MPSFRLKIWHIEQICVFELAWGKGQQLTAKLPFLNTLKTQYQSWQAAYMDFYRSNAFQQSLLRARVEISGTMATPDVDWRARLAQAEAELTTEFHHWLSSANLLKIRREIASAGQSAVNPSQSTQIAAQTVDVFLTCDSVELERLPWETWEIGTEFAATQMIRIVRTPANIQAETGSRSRPGKMRVLAILGDDTGLNFQAERAALQSLKPLAEVSFVGWQAGKETRNLLEEIQRAIADSNGWDILFFAGHSNETNLTGGELTISPNQSILVSEIASQLRLAKQHGLQFAIFNSCKGLSIANSLIDLGLGQVAVMREPIHNQVAQEFLIRFVRELTTYQDVQDGLRSTCQSFKLDKNLTYPSAYLIPSLFRHPDSIPFRLKPFGWQEKLKQWLPTKPEVIALAILLALSLYSPLQRWLLEQRVLTQALYRQTTGQLGKATVPPILLVQIDDRSLQKARIANPKPMPRDYLARLVNQVSTLDAGVVGIDFWLDRPHPEDPQFRKALEAAIARQQSWLVFAVHESETREWLMVTPEAASPTWSLQGDGTIPLWHIKPLPWLDSTPPPFSYLLATAYRLRTEPFQPDPALQIPSPSLKHQTDLLRQVRETTTNAVPANRKLLVSEAMQLHTVTAFSYLLSQRWLQPILDFSIPPNQIYDTIPAWQLLEQPETVLRSQGITSLKSRLVMIVAGGYSEAGAGFEGEDNFPLHAAIAQSQVSWTGVIDVIFGRKEPRDSGPRRRGGPRPPDLCWITPADKVWNSRPMFVWLGGTRLVGVRQDGKETALWQKAALVKNYFVGQTPNRYFVEPDTALQPGKAYEWLFFDPTTRSLRLRVPFQIMDDKERTSITTDLAKLDAKLKASRTKTEEIALARANFFSQRQLWSDAIQEVYSVKNPSLELQRVAQDIEKEICKPRPAQDL